MVKLLLSRHYNARVSIGVLGKRESESYARSVAGSHITERLTLLELEL
jgi:hypothetical protein